MGKMICLGLLAAAAVVAGGLASPGEQGKGGEGETGVSAAVDNEHLRVLFEADQASRTGGNIDWSVVSKEDKQRREEVVSILEGMGLRTANDYYHAAMVFQHGESADEIRTAYSLAWLATVLEPQNKKALWLSAAAWDRIMMREEMPQWYGTQFWKPTMDSPWELYEVDEAAVTDEDRARMSVPPLAEAREKAKSLNQRNP